ncbi:HAD family hydrolase [Listeria fleischmannii]|uniref:HAD family hydrolase n=1 Tax=Listeria fleischmannii TaxID=1069827 RepID=UPI0016242967|nr:HAD family hydrolase [Listeria fleischmannii]MBC1418150.1 HAD family hydrolase [Listeria fleischmannii]
MLKAIIMDFDGVIVDTEVIWYDIFKEWFQKEQNYDVSIEEFLICVGASDDAFFKQLAEEKGIRVDRTKFAEETKKQFMERSKDLPPKDGVVSFIKQVKQAGLKLALATSSMREKPVSHLTRLELLEFFDIIVTAEDVKRIKPAPDLFQAAIQKLGVTKEEAMIIEDSKNGLKAGNQAEIPVIVVPNEVTKHSDLTPNYRLIDSLVGFDVEKLKNEVEKHAAK